MDLTITHMVLVHERIALCLDTLVTAHVLIVVIVPRSSCSRHMTRNKKWFFSLTPLSHKEYATFGDDKKGKVFSTDIIKVNYYTLNEVTLVDKLRYNLFSVSQLVDADLDVLFHKSSL
jgi:hypothetical protein